MNIEEQSRELARHILRDELHGLKERGDVYSDLIRKLEEVLAEVKAERDAAIEEALHWRRLSDVGSFPNRANIEAAVAARLEENTRLKENTDGQA